jgi:(p)ppGpp synthase/HD superfamily hydrolase
MPTIEDAIILAAEAHRGQLDRAGQPYILHPLRVMQSVEDETAKVVAALHDVVEDSTITLDDLRAKGYSDEIVAAVDCLTRRKSESYAEMIERIKPNPLAVRVKLGDLADHSDIRSLNRPLKDDDFERFKRYHAAWLALSPLAHE